MSEVKINSVTDARGYREQLAARKAENDPRLKTWRIVERTVLLGVLAASFLIYHLISVNIEILSLPEINVSVKVPTQQKGSHRI